MREPSILLRQFALHARAAVLSVAVLLAVAISVPMLAHADPTPLAVSTASLPAAEVNANYSQTLGATGGTAPYTWTLVTGPLPLGISLNGTTGALTGTPTVVGTSPITVRVTDNAGTTATAGLTLAVNGAVAVSTATLPASQVGALYSQTLAATSGVGPYSWSIAGGALPAGLSLNATTGVISGTPTTLSTGTFTVRVTDSYLRTADQSLSIVVGQPVQTSTTSLADGTVGAAYSQTLAASGGTTPYTWSITSGMLPGGLTLNTSTGVIAGTPTTAGTSSFAVQVTDASGQMASGALSINVANASTLAITSASLPNGTVGSPYAQTLAASGGVAPYSWSVVGSGLPVGLTLSTNGVLSGTPTTAGTSTFTVRVTDSASHTANASLSLLVNTSTIAVSNTNADVLAACARGNLSNSTARLCELYTSGQLPPYAQTVIGRIILKFTDEQPMTFAERVAAACSASGTTASIATLCSLYTSGDLPAWAKANIGGIILGVTGNAQVSFKDDDEHEHGGKSHFEIRIKSEGPKSKAEATPTVVVKFNANAGHDDDHKADDHKKDDDHKGGDHKRGDDRDEHEGRDGSFGGKVTTTVTSMFKKH